MLSACPEDGGSEICLDGILGVKNQGSLLFIRRRIEEALKWEKRRGYIERERERERSNRVIREEERKEKRKQERHPQSTTDSQSPLSEDKQPACALSVQ